MCCTCGGFWDLHENYSAVVSFLFFFLDFLALLWCAFSLVEDLRCVSSISELLGDRFVESDFVCSDSNTLALRFASRDNSSNLACAEALVRSSCSARSRS